MAKKTRQYIETLVQFIKKEINFDELYDLFYFEYMDDCPELESESENFFSEICEKMDYTADEGTPEEDRKYGWINIDEFRIWLTEYLNANRKNISF